MRPALGTCAEVRFESSCCWDTEYFEDSMLGLEAPAYRVFRAGLDAARVSDSMLQVSNALCTEGEVTASPRYCHDLPSRTSSCMKSLRSTLIFPSLPPQKLVV